MTAIAASPLVATSIAQVAYQFGVNRRTVNDWLSRGCPGERGHYPLPEIIQWYITEIVKQPAAPSPSWGDESGKPALERYREARAELEWNKVRQADDELVRVDEIDAALNRCARIIRDAGERLQKRFGAEAFHILDDALQEFAETIGGGADGDS